jgi:Zn-dependent peptidase ImmA (M78 family)/transcriptional regulator with XRE-family HTH domain
MKTPQNNELGTRLRAARKIAGLSLEDLAGKMGGIVSRQALSKYEQGEMNPGPQVRNSLSRVLNIDSAPDLRTPVLYSKPTTYSSQLPPEHSMRLKDREELYTSVYFNALDAPPQSPTLSSAPRAPWSQFDQAPISEASIQFRERRRLSAKRLTALRYRLADYVRRLKEVELLLGTRSEFKNPLRERDLSSLDGIERAASELRQAWGQGTAPIVNLLGLIESKGIDVLETDDGEEFDGLSARIGQKSVIVVNRAFPDDRMRFTAAHELAHILCSLPKGESAESLCHAFAAALLLPEAALKKALIRPGRKITLGELTEIKQTYGLSLQAIMYRAHSLAFVSDRQLRHVRETFKANGWAKKEPADYNGRERATRLRRLLNYAVAENIIDTASAARLAGLPQSEIEKDTSLVF